MVWTYDETTERLRDESGRHIGTVEPASGPLASRAPAMHAALLRVRQHFAGCGACSPTQAAVWHDFISEAMGESLPSPEDSP